ncbi:hypothetical protein SteCoe_38155 [Stentor coeruleus]|uniref:Uncharacterized protein n=1 Tax=Stentor coeruleus TaxID=5963 RepID=A0A1R2ALU3_9CILI|nr:hypothetical protein SteCoe_38155 [Stentor coeruleus]
MAEQPGNDHWENFRIRTIVFSPNDLKTKWTITIRELVFSKEKLQLACRTFEEKKKDAKELIIKYLFSSADSTSEYPSRT